MGADISSLTLVLNSLNSLSRTAPNVAATVNIWQNSHLHLSGFEIAVRTPPGVRRNRGKIRE